MDYATGQFWSTTFNGSLPVYVLDVNIGGTVYCYVHDNGTPKAGVSVYLFTLSGSYTGLSAITNSSGYAEFNGVLSTVTYRFRVDYNSQQYWSTSFNGSVDKIVVSVNVHLGISPQSTTFERIVFIKSENSKIKIAKF